MYDNLDIIEFIGLPGSGKSYIVKGLNKSKFGADIYCTEDILVSNLFHNRNEFLKHFLLFNLSNFPLLLFLIGQSLSKRKVLKYKLIRSLNLIVKLVALSHLNSTVSKKSVVILDQGLIQLLWSFVNKDGKSTVQLRNFDILYAKLQDFQPDLCIYVECDQKENLSRISKREKECTFKSHKRKVLINILSDGKLFFDSFYGTSNVSCLKINSGHNLEENATRIESFLYENSYNYK